MFINGCFEGGGIKGLTYVGAVRFLEERGFKFFKVCGTSVGALFAALIAVGYTSNEIEEIIEEIDYKLIASKNKIKDGVRNLGVYSITLLENKLYELFSNKGKIKFKDLKYGDDYLLKIVATELKIKQMVIIPDDLEKFGYSKDEFLISKAVAMSCSIPLVFNQYKLGKYVFVDGGVVNNFPIELIMDNSPIIGFRLNCDKNNYLIRIRNKIFKINKSFKIDNINIIYFDSLLVRSSQFKKGLAGRKRLYRIGYDATRDYFYRNIYPV